MRLMLVLAFCFFPALASAGPKEICIYALENGGVKQVPSRADIPRAYLPNSRCFAAGHNEYLAKPGDVKLEGTSRREDMLSPVGRIQLRWPRKVETLFGRTPSRAMIDAARTVARALSKSSFPSELQNLKIDWEVIFLDAELPETQIPGYLVQNCHPGWMTPPANIYVVAQRVAGGCGGPKVSEGVADATLAQVLVHEMGHAVEYFMLKGTNGGDRMRAEGFASWFEQYAAQYSSIINRRRVEAEFAGLAKESLRKQKGSFYFQGSAEDYARASLYFSAIVDRRGLDSLMDVYRVMAGENLNFSAAVSKKLGWNEARLQEEAARYGESRR